MTSPQYRYIGIHNNQEQQSEQQLQPQQQELQHQQQQQEIDDLPPNTNYNLVFKMFTQDLPLYERCKEDLIQVSYIIIIVYFVN